MTSLIYEQHNYRKSAHHKIFLLAHLGLRLVYRLTNENKGLSKTKTKTNISSLGGKTQTSKVDKHRATYLLVLRARADRLWRPFVCEK